MCVNPTECWFPPVEQITSVHIIYYLALVLPWATQGTPVAVLVWVFQPPCTSSQCLGKQRPCWNPPVMLLECETGACVAGSGKQHCGLQPQRQLDSAKGLCGLERDKPGFALFCLSFFSKIWSAVFLWGGLFQEKIIDSKGNPESKIIFVYLPLSLTLVKQTY